ncbi:hypothetical protein B0H63DRAFT_178827 [Podospora didyma]|uniref:Uncharacterized protein n=1 Tax=Podospora didyma TaxID=330526 RepID=A0AAE0NP19_9PEZI|nr:hypothetical protein B0H63DRAFT_178827 [Podospora didyma]
MDAFSGNYRRLGPFIIGPGPVVSGSIFLVEGKRRGCCHSVVTLSVLVPFTSLTLVVCSGEISFCHHVIALRGLGFTPCSHKHVERLMDAVLVADSCLEKGSESCIPIGARALQMLAFGKVGYSTSFGSRIMIQTRQTPKYHPTPCRCSRRLWCW